MYPEVARVASVPVPLQTTSQGFHGRNRASEMGAFANCSGSTSIRIKHAYRTLGNRGQMYQQTQRYPGSLEDYHERIDRKTSQAHQSQAQRVFAQVKRTGVCNEPNTASACSRESSATAFAMSQSTPAARKFQQIGKLAPPQITLLLILATSLDGSIRHLRHFRVPDV